MSTASSTSTLKRCVKCSRDLTGQRRMKDSKGQYWCYECGSADEAKKGSGSLVQPCPMCNKPVHAKNMVRVKGKYVCEDCGGGVKSKGHRSEGDDAARKDKIKLVAAGGMLVVAGIWFYVSNFVMV